MKNFYLYMLQIQNYDDVGVKSLLIAGIITLSGVCVYLYKSKDEAIKQRDERIMKVINNHQNDLKESNTDMKTLIDRYNQFTQNLKDVLNNGK